MFGVQAAINAASIGIGFVAAVCFCIGAATNGPKNIALSSATIVGANPSMMRSLSAQRAQYLVGALLLVVSFALQVGAILAPENARIAVPTFLQAPLPFLGLALAVGAIGSFLAIRWLTNHTVWKAREALETLKKEQGRNR